LPIDSKHGALHCLYEFARLDHIVYNIAHYDRFFAPRGNMLHFGLAGTDEIAREFGKRLRAHRLAQNIQQAELAARAGISRRTLIDFEHSGRGSFDVFLRVAMALGLIDSMSGLFELKPKSIKDMEKASEKRQRASRRHPT
jgi:DNA-binding XRE family transcriptional regulator